MTAGGWKNLLTQIEGARNVGIWDKPLNMDSQNSFGY